MSNDFDLEHYFELSPDFVCVVGYDGYFKKVNSAVLKALGYTTEELMSVPLINFVYSEDRSRTTSTFKKLLSSLPVVNFENRYTTKGGEVRWLSWTSIPIESERLLFAVAKDITHQRKLDEDRNLLLTNMTKSVDDLKQLTYATSHDLRSPVNNLLAVFSMLDDSKIQDNETRKFIGMLRLATDNLRDTLNNYLEMLSQKDILKVSLEELDLEECLDSVLTSLASLMEHTHAEIQTDFTVFKRVRSNKFYLESIYLNLLTNSIKYAKVGCFPKIFVHTRVENGERQLVFSDEGQGFDMEQVKDRVFGLHQKFHDHKDSKGIGLYLVHHHVTSMGGRIQLQSKPGEGATFIISFE